MEILTTKKDDVLTVSLTGRLDTTTSPQLDEELKKSLDGIRELTMINVSSMVMDVFEVTGFSDILTIE